MTRLPARPRTMFVLLVTGVLLAAPPVTATETAARRSYDLPNGLATTTLRQFIAQSGVQLLYVADEVLSVTTNAVRGEFTAREAVNRMLANTGLTAVETGNGAIAVNRAALPNGHRVARTTAGDHPRNQANPARTRMLRRL